MFEMQSNYGSPITVSNDGHRYENADVCVALGTRDVLLTPKKARKLAKEIKRHAKYAEAVRFERMIDGAR